MNSRQVQRIGRIARIISGSGFPPEYQGRAHGDLPFVKVSDLARSENSDGIVGAANYVSYADQRSLRARTVPTGSVIFPKVGAALLGNARSITLTDCLLDNNVMALVPREGDVRFWKYALLTIDLAELSGSGPLPYVSDSQVRDIRIPFPLELEQRRIADFLDAETVRIDGLIEAQQSAIELIGERRRRVLEGIFIPDNAVSVPLGYVTEYSRPIMYGIVLPGPNVEVGVPIVKGGDVAAGRLSLAQLNKTAYEIEANYTRSRLRGGDLVIAIRGSVGEVARVPDEIEGANLTQDAARIAPGPNLQARWLELVLETPSLQEQIGNRITGATVKGINIWDLRRVLIPQISVDKQSRAVKAVDGVLATMDDFVSSAKRQLLLLAERRQALITAAVTGGITV